MQRLKLEICLRIRRNVEAYLENLATEHNMSEAELNEFMWFSLDDYLIENNYMDSEGVWLD